MVIPSNNFTSKESTQRGLSFELYVNFIELSNQNLLSSKCLSQLF